MVVALAIMMLLGSCGSTKDIVYFQGVDDLDLSPSKGLYDARIFPKDMLMINVSTTDPEASKPFNLNYQNNMTGSNIAGMNMYGYLVDNDGNINFPMIGMLHVEGLTTRECESLILDKIKFYMAKNETPIVTVRLSSYHITLIGETGSRIVPVTTEKMNIVEALANGGDLTMTGRRDNILLIREDKTGQKSIHRLDISKGDIAAAFCKKFTVFADSASYIYDSASGKDHLLFFQKSKISPYIVILAKFISPLKILGSFVPHFRFFAHFCFAPLHKNILNDMPKSLKLQPPRGLWHINFSGNVCLVDRHRRKK